MSPKQIRTLILNIAALIAFIISALLLTHECVRIMQRYPAPVKAPTPAVSPLLSTT